jgi:hypothetical protein
MAINEESLNHSIPKAKMDETSPLLSTPGLATQPDTNAAQLRRRRVYVVAFILVTCINLSGIVFEPAQARIFESAFCRAWYQEHDPALVGPGGVAEAHCKIPQVQRNVASLSGMPLGAVILVGSILITDPSGWKQTLDAMPGT